MRFVRNNVNDSGIKVEKKAKIADFSTFFIKNKFRACVCAKKAVPLSRKM